jgi:hypothetical protein
MTDEYTYQVSVKFGGHDESMVNLRAGTEQELDTRLRYLIDNAGTIVLAADTLRATAVERQPMAAATASTPHAHNYGAQVPQQPPGGPPPPPAQPAYQPQPAAPTCAHGPMIYKSGVSKTSRKPYSAHFCPAPQDQPRCAPVWG